MPLVFNDGSWGQKINTKTKIMVQQERGGGRLQNVDPETQLTKIKEQIMTNKLLFFFNTKQIISRDLIWFR